MRMMKSQRGKRWYKQWWTDKETVKKNGNPQNYYTES